MGHRGWLLVAVALLKSFPPSERSEVISTQEVVSFVGQDTLLPCHISATKALQIVEVEWKKITDGHLEAIYSYRQSGAKAEQGNLKRAWLETSEIGTGNVSLTLRKVQPADGGTYLCIVSSGDWSGQTSTMLSIAGTGEVSIEVLLPQGQGLELICRSQGWFPKPTVQWVAENGQSLTPDTAVQQDSNQLFSVLSRVTVTRGGVGEVTCQILNPLLQTQKKSTLLLSSQSQQHKEESLLSSDVFPCCSLPIWIIIPLFLLGLAAAAFLLARGGAAVKESTRRALESKQQLQQLSQEMETLQKAFQTSQEAAQHDLEMLRAALETKLELFRVQRYQGDVTLDAATAHPRLQICDAGKSVADTGAIRPLPRSELRFDCHLFVLAKEGYTSGRHYWQVDVGKRRSWTLGVAREPVTRKGTLTLSPENGFWTIGLVGGTDCWAYTDPWCRVGVSGRLQMVGVFLDISAKLLSFYNLHKGTALYTFSIAGGSSQAEKFFPFFSTGSAAGEPEEEALRIVEGFE